ncbi:unnamed protein product [Calicophoron daubneyi]|uniref:LITAF domain-containing protein n=1 Tax=Calicophoron daubneyi TaxID=300641 RepID=A0AAV2TSE7_CALDB
MNLSQLPFSFSPAIDCKPSTSGEVKKPVTVQPLKPYSIVVTCPYCHKEVKTKTRQRHGLLTFLSCMGLCLMGCVCGCCFVPFCVNCLKDVDHLCPSCNQEIGTFERV